MKHPPSSADPAARKLDPRAQRSREALREALGAMLTERPIEQITILALTEKAGVGYATFFRNYADIEALLADLSSSLIAEMASLIALTPRSSTHDAALTIATFVDERRSLFAPLLVGASATLQREIIMHATKVGHANRRKHDSNVPLQVGISHTVVVISNLMAWWIEAGDSYSVAQFADLIDRLAFQPLGFERS